MAGIDKAAIAFTIAIVAAGVGMAFYGESTQSAPTVSAPIIPEPTTAPTETEDPMEETDSMMEEAAMEETDEMMEETDSMMEEAAMEEPISDSAHTEGSNTDDTMEETAGPATVTVDIPIGTSVPGCQTTNECYIPESVTINAGDTVEWINIDTAAHTVTSGLPSDGPSGEFDSSLILANATYSVTFEEPGSYDYFCIVHPWMVGNVQVN